MDEEAFRALLTHTDPDDVAEDDIRDEDDPTWAFIEAGQPYGEAKLHGTQFERRIMTLMRRYADKHGYEFESRYRDPSTYFEPVVAAVLELGVEFLTLHEDGSVTYKPENGQPHSIDPSQIESFIYDDPRGVPDVDPRQAAREAFDQALATFASDMEGSGLDYLEGGDHDHVDAERVMSGIAPDLAENFFHENPDWKSWASLLKMSRGTMKSVVVDVVYDALMKGMPKAASPDRA
jgi:hypothetical protein